MIKKIIITLFGLGIIYVILISSIIYFNSNDKLPNENISIDYTIILGAQVMEDGNPSPKLKDRLDTAIRYSKYNDSKIIVSGGRGIDEPTYESEAMKNYLILNEIDENRIIEENKATSTFENLLYSKNKINNFNESNVLIISNSYHMARVKMLDKRLGYKNTYYLGATNSANIKDYSREILAYSKSYIFDYE